MNFAVAVDGSDPAEAALDHALDVAEGLDASLTALYVVNPKVYQERGSDPITDRSDAEDRLVVEDVDDAERRGTDVLEAAAARGADRDVEVRTELRHGDPVETLATYAEEADLDGLFVGHRGLSADRERVLGSVAKGVVDRSSVPVTVVQ